MPIQTEMLRIESKALMEIIHDAAVKMNEKNHDHFSYDLRKEFIDVFDNLTLRSTPFVYILRVHFRSGVFHIGGANFEFEAETLDEIYRVAMITIKAWADEYFKKA